MFWLITKRLMPMFPKIAEMVSIIQTELSSNCVTLSVYTIWQLFVHICVSAHVLCLLVYLNDTFSKHKKNENMSRLETILGKSV